MLSSPGCWAAYGEVLRREYSDVGYMRNHRLTVDAYAVQHPGKPTPPAIRSVRAHLCMLHVILELGWSHARAVGFLQTFADRNKQRELEWLEPPDDLGEMTVADVHGTSGLEAHLAVVERWARSAWEAWVEHHERVRAWVRGEE